MALLPEDLDQELYKSNRLLFMLTERVINNQLRESVKDLCKLMVVVLMARVEIESFTTMESANTLYEETMVLLGNVLRENY